MYVGRQPSQQLSWGRQIVMQNGCPSSYKNDLPQALQGMRTGLLAYYSFNGVQVGRAMTNKNNIK